MGSPRGRKAIGTVRFTSRRGLTGRTCRERTRAGSFTRASGCTVPRRGTRAAGGTARRGTKEGVGAKGANTADRS